MLVQTGSRRQRQFVTSVIRGPWRPRQLSCPGRGGRPRVGASRWCLLAGITSWSWPVSSWNWVRCYFTTGPISGGPGHAAHYGKPDDLIIPHKVAVSNTYRGACFAFRRRPNRTGLPVPRMMAARLARCFAVAVFRSCRLSRCASRRIVAGVLVPCRLACVVARLRHRAVQYSCLGRVATNRSPHASPPPHDLGAGHALTRW